MSNTTQPGSSLPPDSERALDEMRRIVNRMADTDIVRLLVVILLEKQVILPSEYIGLIDARLAKGGPKVDIDDPMFMRLYEERMTLWRKLADE